MSLNYEFFYEWTNKNLNLNLAGYKEKQLQRRIASVMKNAGAFTLEDYSKRIEKDETVKQQFLDYITINVTDFFRNQDIFEEFESELKILSQTFPSMKVWSAACSTGAEAYSMAMIFDKHQLRMAEKILATDIDETILKRAKEGMYKIHEMKNVPAKERSAYFDEKEGIFYLKSNIKNKVQFKRHDLIADKFQKNFHIIVCRNVTIYFKNEVKEELYQRFSDSLVKGGIFFTGATEAIYSPEIYGLKKISAFMYEKL
ncbi:chemotaxis protein methyltransferase CheR [Carnobacterium iners]|uniref:Chemotaxis protein methyltransferase CheR n=1 Tax=Carnobacterium iners TaxID=1073423 RepID=A0A1X7N204_9LACT|nr:protein-glutamate O-methyltransferase CheR [Carnobacterium iners]SEK21145.1 chemotaxis protein methyltransferase CheR [Carnobacterium iners]SMH30452.1 chemotaxis protein methyltransferase CheR [Carnobacterium iners]